MQTPLEDQQVIAGDGQKNELGRVDVSFFVGRMVENGIDEQMANTVCSRITRDIDLSDKASVIAVGEFVDTVIQHTDSGHRLCLVG